MVEKQLLAAGVPHRVLGGVALAGRKEVRTALSLTRTRMLTRSSHQVKDALAYVRLAINQRDGLAFGRAVRLVACVFFYRANTPRDADQRARARLRQEDRDRTRCAPCMYIGASHRRGAEAQGKACGLSAYETLKCYGAPQTHSGSSSKRVDHSAFAVAPLSFPVPKTFKRNDKCVAAARQWPFSAC
jgi:hypothetical protein